MIKKILIFSDSHGDDSDFIKVIESTSPDITIHAGDFCDDFNKMKRYFNYIVAGNNDSQGEEELYFDLFGVKIFLSHGHKYISHLNSHETNALKILEGNKNKKIDLIIYGHTHIESVITVNKILSINPGSIKSPRSIKNKKSYAVIHIENGKILESSFHEIIKYL